MPRPTGLQGSIGTGAHLVNRWTPERVDAWLRSFYGREGAIRGAKAALAAADAFFAEHFAVIFCTVCGDQIERGNRDRVAWASVRKCDACLAAKRQAGDTKFCRQCRCTLTLPDATGSRTEASIRKGWATKATCDDCKRINEIVGKQAPAVMREARAQGAKDYQASLSPHLRNRLERNRR